MNIKDFESGFYRKNLDYNYFLPTSINHDWFSSNNKITQKLELASIKLGELNSFAKFIPNVNLFIQSYVMKEAVTSSRIEGTKTNIEEAFSDELDIDPEKRNDWNETLQYVQALNFSLDKATELPLSSRLIKETHKILLDQVRGRNKTPGEFRTSQNWIGGSNISNAVFVPPSAEHIDILMSDLEKFIHNSLIAVPHLIKIAIIHYQFETIHPFLDGNGRVGRLLVPLYLVSNNILDKPFLYISDYLEKNKNTYYDKLTEVRTKNNLESWIMFFLEGVEQTSIEAVNLLKNIILLREILIKDKISTMGKKTQNALRLLDLLFEKPVLSSNTTSNKLDLTTKTTNSILNKFIELNIISEVTGHKRNRIFIFTEYLNILNS